MMQLVPDFRFDANLEERKALRISTALHNIYDFQSEAVLQRLECNALMNEKLAENALLIYTDGQGGYVYFDAEEDPALIEQELADPCLLTMYELEEQVFESLFAATDDRGDSEY